MLSPFLPTASPPSIDTAKNVTLRLLSASTSSAQLIVPNGKTWRVLAITCSATSGATAGPMINTISLYAGSLSTGQVYMTGSRGMYVTSSGTLTGLRIVANTGGTSGGVNIFNNPILNGSALWDPGSEVRPFITVLTGNAGGTTYIQNGQNNNPTLYALVEEFDSQ